MVADMVMYCGVRNMEKCRGVEAERHMLVAMNDTLLGEGEITYGKLRFSQPTYSFNHFW